MYSWAIKLSERKMTLNTVGRWCNSPHAEETFQTDVMERSLISNIYNS